jgi:hypothetical protein
MERNLLKRVGNFKVFEVKRKNLPYVIITTVTEDWKIEYRVDCPMYLVVKTLVDKEKELLNFCTLMFVMSYTMHSADTYEAIMVSVMKELDKVGKPDVSEEEEAKALEETVQMEELAEKVIENG